MLETILKDLTAAYGPTGREETVSAVIRRYAEPLADEVYSDALGNLIAHKKGTSGKKLMLSAHMDQIGLIVLDIDDAGFLRVSNVGGVNANIALARPVVFENGTRGVTHFETEKKTPGTATMPELFIDIGASTRAEAEQRVSIGDIAVYVSDYTRLSGDLVSSGALDNRIGCAAVLEALRLASSPHDLYAVFTVQEEVGMRGAGAAAYAVNPDFSLNIDVCGTGDTPKALRQSVCIGKGPTVKVMDGSVVVPSPVRRFLIDCAARAGVPYQNEVLRSGGTDTGAIQRTRAGIPAGCVSIPTRYVHTPVETASLTDAENAAKLAAAAAESETLPVIERRM